ncbi:MAG: N-acetylneuraminate synthase family protein [Rhodospirillum sp.]|nr:N-acetylneuraminate synthase family protein [Rhodospirillum sp.]MCF8489112.1 N-acetylneuraminate synthase family protein [Rhodospirillum sp.]MCF8498902.1 N-acetylneuraminate synthase family protein [Rhodospirillum sp.]
MSIEIAGRKVGPGQPVLVVAEMAWAHDGSTEKARIIIDAAADAGADAINLHLTDIPSYMVTYYGSGEGRVSAGKENSKVFDYLRDINLSFEDITALVAHARERGLLVSAMCNDWPSLAFARDDLGPDILMIHPSCVCENRFLEAMLAVGKPVVIYVGGLTLSEIERAVATAKRVGNDRVILQHGFQSYPTAIEDNNLAYLDTLRDLFGLPVAFGDHTDGDDPMAMVVPLLAVARGAEVIEKHITHDRMAKGEDFEAALGPDAFKVFVTQLRQAETAMGSAHWRPLSERELKYRSVVRKRAVADGPIAAGTPITHDNVVFKRCDVGLFPEELEGFLGRPAQRDLVGEEAITEKDIIG